jgi:Streptomyces sporulation and cell division protein, SsgA
MSTHSITTTGFILLPNGGRTPVNVTFTYDTDDAAAVSLRFHSLDPDPIVWTFARNILQLGLDERTEEGADVVAWPNRDGDGRVSGLNLKISSPFGEAEFLFYAEPITDFLNDTFAMIPMGFEFDNINLDAELVKLLADDGGNTI